jgi:hypothetical protein
MQGIKKPLTAAELSLVLDISEFTVKKLARAKQLPCGYTKNGQPRFDMGTLFRHFRRLEGGEQC